MDVALSAATRKPLSRANARIAAVVNQLATPGLGSLVARRWIAGTGQLLLAVIGFVLMVFWFIKLMIRYYSLINDPNPKNTPIDFKLAVIGAGIFFIAWLWSWVTTISVLREARRNSMAELQKPL
jgi:hypothetical protein